MIKKLHERLIENINFGPEEGQGNNDNLSCSNERKSVIPCPSFGFKGDFSKDTLLSLEELGNILKSIRERMYNEGYEIVDGIVKNVNFNNKYERNKK